jgi:hypothetical protein
MMFSVSALRDGTVSSIFAATLSLLQVGAAQSLLKPPPKFEDYPVKEVFNQTLQPPILVTPEQHRFRTRIREGVEKGWGVWINGEWGKEQSRPGPNFAGHYIVIVWGCGSECLRMAMSNAETGAVYNPPVSGDVGLALPMLVLPNSPGRAADMEYRRDSRLMIIRATPNSDRLNAVPCVFYFLWQDEHWTLLRRIAIVD